MSRPKNLVRSRRVTVRRANQFVAEPGTEAQEEKRSPIPRRNGRCPEHPEHKFKKCPHGCYRKPRLLQIRVKEKWLSPE